VKKAYVLLLVFGSIDFYSASAERCTNYTKSVRLSVRLASVTRWHCVKVTCATIMRSSLRIAPWL